MLRKWLKTPEPWAIHQKHDGSWEMSCYVHTFEHNWTEEVYFPGVHDFMDAGIPGCANRERYQYWTYVVHHDPDEALRIAQDRIEAFKKKPDWWFLFVTVSCGIQYQLKMVDKTENQSHKDSRVVLLNRDDRDFWVWMYCNPVEMLKLAAEKIEQYKKTEGYKRELDEIIEQRVRDRKAEWERKERERPVNAGDVKKISAGIGLIENALKEYGGGR
jgi:hypothetical protein